MQFDGKINEKCLNERRQGMMSPNGEVAMPPQTEKGQPRSAHSELRVSDLEEAGKTKKGAWLK